MISNRVKAVPLAVKDSSTLTGNFDLLKDGLEEACFLVRIINNCDKDITISYDGANDNDFAVAKTVSRVTEIQLDFQLDNRRLAKGTKIYVKGAVGTGNIYLVGYYT